MTASVSSPVMVGRDADLQVLRGAWEAARAAGPRAVVIRGEAGIGKSRLVTELLESIDGDAAIAVGQCLDTGGSVGAPFASVKGIVRDLAAVFGAETLLEAAGHNADVLTSLVPRLDRGRGTDRPDLGEPSGEDVHETFGDLLETLSQERPLVVLLEDLHWADVTTLALLSALLRMLRRSRVLFLLTYRPEDLGRGHPLRPVLIQLDRHPAAHRVELTPLDEETVAEQARLILGRGLEDHELSQVVRRSDGVPFFVEEFLGASGPGAGLPSTLRELVMARYERLTPGTQRVLRALAAGGSSVEHNLAETVLDGAPGELDAAVAEAVERGILVAGPFDYRFRHALLREGILDVLLPGERFQWHSRYAEALAERPDAESHGVQIAQHWMSAHDLPRAFDATVRAMLSSSTLAPATAAQLGERAIDLWPQVPEAERVAGRPLEQLMHETALEHMSADNAARASAIWDSALAACPPDRPLMRAEILAEKAVCDYERGHYVEALLVEALHLLEGCPETPETIRRRSQAMATWAVCGSEALGPVRAHELAREALELALEAGSPADAARAASFAARLQVMKGDFEDGLAAFDEARAHLPDDPLVNWRHGYLRGIAHLGLGRYEEARADLTRSVSVAEGAPRTQLSPSGSLVVLAMVTGKSGDWAEAERLVHVLRGRPPAQDADVTSATTLLFLHHWRGEHEAARALAASDADSLISEGNNASSIADLLAVLGEIALEDDVDRAWAVLDGTWERSDLEVAHSQGLIAVSARVIGALRRAGRPPPPEAEASLRARGRDLIVTPVADRWWALIDAELSGPGGDGSDLLAWQAAVAALSQGNVPVHLVPYARCRLAELALAAGDRAGALETLAAAVGEAEVLGAGLIAAWCRDLAERAGSPLGAPTEGSMPSLTEREEQVLRLVGEGLSNREIGERLFISPKTASVHVSAILRKLDVTTRTEAAVVAERLAPRV